jgi:RimJ/RimL family protein N-acetyltransferase
MFGNKVRLKLYYRKHLNELWFSIKNKKDVKIGEIGVVNINWKRKEAEINIYITNEIYRNKGYGADAISIVVSYLFNNKQFKNVYLRVFKGNQRAIKCYKKCGFKERGIIRNYRNGDVTGDMLLMEIKNVI